LRCGHTQLKSEVFRQPVIPFFIFRSDDSTSDYDTANFEISKDQMLHNSSKSKLLVYKSQLEFGLNKEYNFFDKPRELEKEIKFIKKLVVVQKETLVEVRKFIKFGNKLYKSFYLIDSFWVEYWLKVTSHELNFNLYLDNQTASREKQKSK
jgi:hypothetical protein